MRKANGFSLIEVLVVVSIIALLIGITMPSFREARRQARKTVCKKNLQQIGLGMHAYLLTNRDTFPWCCRMPSEEHTVAEGENREPYAPLPEALKRETSGKSEVYLCPSDQNLKMAGALPKERYYDSEGLSYEWNGQLNGVHISYKNMRILGGLINLPPSKVWMLNDWESFHGGDKVRGSQNQLYADFHVISR